MAQRSPGPVETELVLPQPSGQRLLSEPGPLAGVPQRPGTQDAELPRSAMEPGTQPLVRQPCLRVAKSAA